MSRFAPRMQASSFIGRIFGSTESRPARDLDDWLEETLKTEFKWDAVERDGDGDIPVPCGSAVVFVRTDTEDPPHIEIFAPLLEDFAMRPEVYEAVNAINRKVPFAKCILDPDTKQIVLVAELPIFDGLSSEQLMATIKHVAETADHYDTLLQKRFGGKTMLDDDDVDEFDV